MSTLATLTFAGISFGVAAFVYTLTAALEPQPEYPPLMTYAVRVLGSLIVLGSAVLGVVFVGYAVTTIGP